MPPPSLSPKEPFQISYHHCHERTVPAFKDADCIQAASLPVEQVVRGLQREASPVQVTLEEAILAVL